MVLKILFISLLHTYVRSKKIDCVAVLDGLSSFQLQDSKLFRIYVLKSDKSDRSMKFGYFNFQSYVGLSWDTKFHDLQFLISRSYEKENSFNDEIYLIFNAAGRNSITHLTLKCSTNKKKILKLNVVSAISTCHQGRRKVWKSGGASSN